MPPGPPTLAAVWAEYEQAVLFDVSPEDRRNMRIAFYAGAAAIFDVLTGKLDDELDRFKADVTKNKARFTQRAGQ